MACKVRDEYSLVKDMQSATPSEQISSTAVAGSSSRQGTWSRKEKVCEEGIG